MKANETKVEEFLSSNKTQFVIPVYQRNYDWTTHQCKQLLDDILEVGANTGMTAHFIGSIVYVHDDVYTSARMKELTVIDGQQRLTTLTLVYLVLYRLAKRMQNEAMVQEISETYLINKFAAEEEKLKLRPTDNNDRALKYLLRSDENEEFDAFSRLVDNFNYFKSRVSEENLDAVMRGLSKLMFVEISLDRTKDNPQRIFESLNSTGLELSQADLIRNYILMGLTRHDQNRIYQNFWEVIEKLAKDETSNTSHVSDYIRDYLTLENKKIPNKNKVYLDFKAKYPTGSVVELESNLIGIKNLVKHYNKMLNPSKESDPEIREELEYVNRLEINVAYPFLMKVYDDYANSVIDKASFLEVLRLVQSFTWRRFILALPTNALNKIFMNLYEKVEHSKYLESLQRALLSRTGVQRFPKDAEVIDALEVKDVYNIKSKNRLYLLERLENHENNEPVVIEGNPQITIEHIFPQNPDPKWKVELGTEEYNDIKENYLNTIANLTLSGNNGKLGNKSFIQKRDLLPGGYIDSRLWLNRHLAKLDRWGLDSLKSRFDIIAERVLKIWPCPDIEVEVERGEGEQNIFDAEDPKHKKLEYAVFFDQRLAVTQVAKLYIEVLRQLFDLNPETFFTSDLGERIGLTKTPDKSGIRHAQPINDTYFVETNLDNIGKFERLKYALTVFDLEDELVVKYADD